MWAGLLGLSFVSTADHWCEFCKKEHGDGECQYRDDITEKRKFVYCSNISVWTDFGEFLKAEQETEIIIVHISRVLCKYIQEHCALKYNFGWQILNVHRDLLSGEVENLRTEGVYYFIEKIIK